MQVTKHIHALKIPFQIMIGPGKSIDRFVYTYLIYGKEICLIDTGVASSEQVIFEYIKKTGRRPDEISMIVLTHSHPDHIGAASAIKKVSGCTVAAHPGEKAWIEDVELQSKERPVPNFHLLVGGPVEVNRVLEEGDILDLGGGLSLKVFHTPGHSGGSISLLLCEDGGLFTGDAVPIAGDVPIYEDALASAMSIGKLKSIDGIKVLLASWNDPQEGDSAYRVMDEGLHYLQRVHQAVINIANKDSSPASFELYRSVLEELGIHGIAANPLIARSFESHLELRGHTDLLT